MRKRLLLLTGNPGVGKTTLLLGIVETVRSNGYSVGGMVSREVRSCGARVGFELLDLSSSKHGWLAHVNQSSGPSVGRYRVNMHDLERFGAEAIINAIHNCDAIFIDEVGPMELLSERFEEAAKKAVESEKLVIGIVHWKARNVLIEEMRRREDAETYVVTSENREGLREIVVSKIIETLRENETK